VWRGRMSVVSSRMLIRAAARSNAEWCHAFSGTHGIDGRFDAAFWSSPVRTPPFYPDAVTLLPEITVDHVLSCIDSGEGCSVKDSFACLDLRTTGFRPLFRAEWVVRQTSKTRLAALRRWSTVVTEDHLREWEASWGEVPGGSGFFRPGLLTNETIAVLAGHDGDRVVAGAIAIRSAAVIGLSNVFDTAGDLDSAWAGAAAAAAALWGDAPTVSYDSGDSLDAAHSAGFESIGQVVVWLRPTTLSLW
jgi:hypothetical protein